METIRLGKTGAMVSKLGFGGIPIQRLSEDEAVAVIRKCIDLGITYIDTANGYTTSEERIGRAAPGSGDGLFIATKTHARDRDGIKRDLKLSLERLRRESIDLYQFHQVGTLDQLKAVLDPGGPMPVLEEAVQAGLIKHIVITSHSMDVAKEAVKSDRFETIMFPFNFIAKEAADELLPLAREHDVGFIAMKPLGGGMLDNAALCFKYLLQFPDIIPIPGIEQSHEIEEIVKIMNGPKELSAEEKSEMTRLTDELGTRFCRRCDYCQPCTEEIAISTVMVSASFAKRFPPERFFTGRIASVMEKASDCSDCGECEERCPYQLPIREMMAEQAEWYHKKRSEYREQTGNRL